MGRLCRALLAAAVPPPILPCLEKSGSTQIHAWSREAYRRLALDAPNAELIECPRHYLVTPIDSLPLTILQEIHNQATNCIFWRLDQVDRFSYFQYHSLSVRHLCQHVRIRAQYMSLQRQLGRRGTFLIP